MPAAPTSGSASTGPKPTRARWHRTAGTDRTVRPAPRGDARHLAEKPRCIALDAEIGVRARCAIHPIKSSVCREVPASWEFGEASPKCDKSRLAHGLSVLVSADWYDDDIAA